MNCEDELKELRETFNVAYDADMRAIKRWQAAHPGNDLKWPDRVDLVVWLMDQVDMQFCDTCIHPFHYELCGAPLVNSLNICICSGANGKRTLL